MVYTVTFNPSLDYVVRITDFELGNLHRSEAEEIYVGGKGINVTTVLKQLGLESTALGFVAGFTGMEIKDRLNQLGISNEFVPVSKGFSRINIKLKSKNRIETEVNGQGPNIETEDLHKLYQRLKEIRERDILVLSGSVSSHMRQKELAYARICELVGSKDIKLVVDAEGELLWNTLKYRPFLIKPNHHELGKLFGQILHTEESIIDCGRRLQREGARNVLISMAGDGALLIDENGQVTRQMAPKGTVINSVGAGDAMVAGFLTGLFRAGENNWRDIYSSKDYEYAVKFGVAAGSAAAFSPGIPTRRAIEELFACL